MGGQAFSDYYGGAPPLGVPQASVLAMSHDPLNDRRPSPAWFWAIIVALLIGVRLLFEAAREE